MAVMTQSFSIREYAVRMRSVDLIKCWPFAGGGEEGRLLPPMSIRRFRWWSDEVSTATARSAEEKEAAVDELALPSPGARAEAEAEAEADGGAALQVADEGRRLSKGKQRAPKKRSIVELFAAVPPIEGAAASDAEADGSQRQEDEASEEDARRGVGAVLEEEREGREEKKKRKRKKKKKKRKVMMMRKKKGVKVRKEKEIRDGIKVMFHSSSREKVWKLKKDSVSSYMLEEPRGKETIEKTAKSIVKRQKKFVRMKNVPKKRYILQIPNMTPRNQEVVKKVPVRSILKNKKKVTLARKSTKVANARAANFIKMYCDSTRHVTFSGKDDILGHSKKSSSMDLPQLKSLCKIFSDVLAASSVINNSNIVRELPPATDRHQLLNACDKDTDTGFVDSKQFSEKNLSSDSHCNVSQPTVVNSSNSSCSGTGKAPLAVMVDLNHAIENNVDCFNPSTSNFSPSCNYSCDPDCWGTIRRNSNISSGFDPEKGMPKTSDASITPNLNRSLISSSDGMSSLTGTKIISPSSSASCLIVPNDTNERQFRPSAATDVNLCHHRPENHSGYCCSRRDLSCSICYSLEPKKSGESVLSNSVSASKSMYSVENFVGLPLNSHGELIQLHPGARFVLPYGKQNNGLDTSYDVCENKYIESNKNMHHFDIVKAKVFGAASYQVNPSDWCQKQCHSTKEHDWSCTGVKFSERLDIDNNEPAKGKDRLLHLNANALSFQDSVGGGVASDLYNKVDHRGNEPVVHRLQPTMRLMGKNVVVGSSNQECQDFDDQKKKEILPRPTPSSRVPEKLLSKKQADYITPSTFRSSRANPFQLSDLPSNFSHIDHHHHHHQPIWLPSNSFCSAVGNETRESIQSSVPGKVSIGMRNQCPPVVSSYPHSLQQQQQQMLFSSTHCKHSQGAACSTLVTAHPQFQFHNIASPCMPPLWQAPAKLPQWLLHAKQQKKNQLPKTTYSDQTALSQVCGVSGASPVSQLSPYHVPVIPFSVHNTQPAQNCDFFARNASQFSYLPIIPAAKPSSEVAMKTNIKKKEREGTTTHSKFSCFKVPADCHKSRKRAKDMDEASIYPSKRPFFEKKVDASSPIGGSIKTGNEKSAFRSIKGSTLPSLANEPTGPIKLIAGAKHILKPCHKVDNDNCRPIHSTIPIAVDATSGKFSNSQKKITRVYKF
ncbi:hypothetical protein AXF42_Ash003041 [Apostasia shenzhenica]|uniref:Uncharacterized protein n=1 Tax=Apostasia shenzhenica TaxID=1088818 RepID=A0A2I0A823_9ASPA|nr:hypothetical protein AXF42_Ash003041 [Apostasia shenzhenica]